MIYDITPLVTPGFPVWPGDTPPGREVLLDLKNGDTITLSTLRATVHLGAHADAPSHYGEPAPSIEAVDLSVYLGRCQVFHLEVEKHTRIGPDRFPLDRLDAPRVLIRTGTYPQDGVFHEDFAALDPSLVDTLHARGVRLIGLDTPSVDLFESKDLPSHKAFLRHRMAILEGLVLDRVPEGLYELIALPLRIAGFDASPVRAVLRTWQPGFADES